MSRYQFSLRTLFAAMTLTALLLAPGQILCRVWQAFDMFAAMLAAIVASAGLGTLLILATLPFAYRRAVTEIDGQNANGTSASRRSAVPGHCKSNRATNIWHDVTIRIMVPLLLGCFFSGVGASLGLDGESTSLHSSAWQAAIGAVLGLLSGMAYTSVLPSPEARLNE